MEANNPSLEAESVGQQKHIYGNARAHLKCMNMQSQMEVKVVSP